MKIPESIESIINEFIKFPGIGHKTAERLAFYLIFQPEEFTTEFIKNIEFYRKQIKYCSICGNIDDTDPCSICSSNHRDNYTICVVETPRDLFAIENANIYNGLYHVLGGAISPIDGITPEKLNFDKLLKRIKPPVNEIIIATNSNIPGEMTALYIKKLLAEYDIKITRIAKGIPFGSDLEYSDKITISNAFTGRTEIKNEPS